LLPFPIWQSNRNHLVQIPIEAGQVFRRDAGQRSDLKPATIPN
jgi:hypothetical protein